jgi:O-glycosyl hydrolase
VSQSIPITNYVQEKDITLDSVPDGVVVQLDKTKQLIRGFGINNTWGALSSQNAIDKCFNKETGLGLNVLRIGMKPDGNAYESYDDVKSARNLGCEYFIGTVWTAPKEWKSNNSENDGGSLNKDKYQDWATRIAAFPAKVKQGTGGIELYAMSPQNETDFASCGMQEPCNGNYQTMLWTGKDYAEFFAIAGPKIKAAGCKAMAPEASEWLHAWSDFSACCTEPGGKGSSDPLKCGFLGKDNKPTCDSTKGYNYGRWLYRNKTAWDAVDIFSTHQYDTQVAEPWPADVPRSNANGTIEVWQTEMSGVKWWPEQGTGTGNNLKCNATIQNGVAVARWIQNALTVGEASAWCYWWWTHLSSGTNDNEGITCQGTLTKRYYTFGNFSRYMRPGQKVVEIAGTETLPAKVLLVASKDDNGKVVIVAINETTTAQTVPITISGGTVPASFKPIITSADKDGWKENESEVPVTNGVLTASLEAMSVTTFVSK